MLDFPRTLSSDGRWGKTRLKKGREKRKKTKNKKQESRRKRGSNPRPYSLSPIRVARGAHVPPELAPLFIIFPGHKKMQKGQGGGGGRGSGPQASEPALFASPSLSGWSVDSHTGGEGGQSNANVIVHRFELLPPPLMMLCLSEERK